MTQTYPVRVENIQHKTSKWRLAALYLMARLWPRC